MARLTQKQVEDWIAQNGGSGGVQYSVEQKQIRNPSADAAEQILQPYVPVEVEVWRNARTGAELSIRRIDADTVEQIENKSADPNKPTASTAEPAIPPGGSSSTEGTQNPDGSWDNNRPRKVIKDKNGAVVWSKELEGSDLTAWRTNQQAGQPQSGEKQEPVEGRPGWTSITRVTKQGGNEKSTRVFVGPDGVEVPTLPEQAQSGESSEPVKDRPGWRSITRIKKEGGKETKEVVFVGPDNVEVPTLPAETASDSKPLEGHPGWTVKTVKNGNETKTVFVNPQGVEAQDPRGSKATFGVTEPAGAPASGQYGAQSESLVKYRDFLNQQVTGKQLMPDGTTRTFTPTLTLDQADKLMEVRLAQTKFGMAEQSEVVGTQTGIFGQQTNQRGQSLRDTESRRNAANSVHSTVMQNFMPLLKYMPKGGGQAFLDLLSHGMGAAQQNATAWGGLRESPEIQLGPAAAAANRAPMPGSQGVAPIAPTPTQGTFMAPYDPNAAAAAEASRQAAEAQLAAGQMPQLNVPPTMAARPDGAVIGAQAPLPAPLLPPSRPDQTQVGGQIDNAIMPPQAVPAGIDPNLGQPGDPVWPNVAPGYGAPIFQPGMNSMPPDPTTPGGVSQMAPSFLDPYQQQSSGALDSLLADDWMPNHLLARAYQDVYGEPHPLLGPLAA